MVAVTIVLGTTTALLSAGILPFFFGIYFSSVKYCDSFFSHLALALIVLTCLVTVAAICVPVFVIWRKFTIGIPLAFLKLVSLFVVLVIAWHAISSMGKGGDSTQEMWVGRAGDDWVKCLAKENFCHRVGNDIKNCCQQPLECQTGHGNSTARNCAHWRPSTTLCYACDECKTAVYGKLAEKWSSLTAWYTMLLLVADFALAVGELGYTMWLWRMLGIYNNRHPIMELRTRQGQRQAPQYPQAQQHPQAPQQPVQ